MSEVYEYVDDNGKIYEEVLTVDFTFPNGTSLSDAVNQIDMLVSLADNETKIEFYEHQPKIYTKSPLYEPEEDLYM